MCDASGGVLRCYTLTHARESCTRVLCQKFDESSRKFFLYKKVSLQTWLTVNMADRVHQLKHSWLIKSCTFVYMHAGLFCRTELHIIWCKELVQEKLAQENMTLAEENCIWYKILEHCVISNLKLSLKNFLKLMVFCLYTYSDVCML